MNTAPRFHGKVNTHFSFWKGTAMDKQKKRILFTVGGVVVALIVIALILLIALGGGNKYEKHYTAAEEAFLTRDYSTALKELDLAMEEKLTEEAYLLLADIYYAQGDKEMATQVLYLGYSRVGGEAISDMLERLKSEEQAVTAPEGITVAGETYGYGETSVVLKAAGLANSDLDTLCTLSALESLTVSENAISSIQSLSTLSSLSVLDISGNRVSDLSALKDLTALKTLYIDRNPITDFSPLYGLKGLRTLSMKGISITADQLTALQNALPDCRIYAEVPVEEIVEITLGGKTFDSSVTELNLGGLDIEDISELSKCTALTKLDLRDNHIKDISALAELQELEWLCLWNNEVESITPLLTLSKLQYLDVDTNAIEDITALAQLGALEELWLSNNPISSIEPLKDLTSLTRLGLKNLNLSDESLDVLMGLGALKELTIEENEGLTQEKFDALQEALPGCTIAHSELISNTEEEDPGEVPEYPGELDAIYISIGKDAAVNYAGTGTGYGIIWGAADKVSASIHSGFVEQAELLGMNLVCDLWFSDAEIELGALLAKAQTAGADVLLLSVSDDVLALVLSEAEALSYTPRFIQIY